MAGNSPRAASSTRYVETTRGILSYSELAPLIAERVLKAERAIESKAFASAALNGNLLLALHFQIAGDLVPDWAGRWRNTEVRVGLHSPPPPHEVAVLIKNYTEDLSARLGFTSGEIDGGLLEMLAFAEGRLLSIHPFTDLNGRVTRLFLRELLRRLELPPVDLVPVDALGEAAYLKALRAGDQLAWEPLAIIWRQRFESFQEVQEPSR